MINRVKIQNFKALRNVEITFDSRFTVLVGPNGSGKTSVLRTIHWLCQIAGDHQSFQHGSQELGRMIASSYSGSNTNEAQLLEVIQIDSNGSLGIRVNAHPQPIFNNTKADRRGARNIEYVSIPKEEKLWIGDGKSLLGKKATFVPSELILLDSNQIAIPSNTTAIPPTMGPNGAGLASLMAYFKLYDENRFDQVQEMFQKIVPHVQRIRIDRVKAGGEGLGEGLVFDLPHKKGVIASSMSDGTLFVLALIAKILDPQHPKTLLIDDIDHGFHPNAQLLLIELIHKLLDEIPDIQIIATSHSPYILSGLKWDEVRVTSLQKDGTAVIEPLSKHPNFEKWKESMSPGEFWTHAGEDWINRLPHIAGVAQ